MTAPRDLLGFVHADLDWGWPHWDEADIGVTDLAHQHAAPGLTACGKPWPDVWPTTVRTAPTEAQIARIRDAEDRTEFLCRECCHALGIAKRLAGPVEVLP